MTEYLWQHAPWLIPIVNQVSGNSAPETLYRSKLFISSPEQYPIQCPASNCSKPGLNATAGAINQMAAYETNALVDLRFGLDSWPLFHIGDSQGFLNETDPDVAPPGKPDTTNVRQAVRNAQQALIDSYVGAQNSYATTAQLSQQYFESARQQLVWQQLEPVEVHRLHTVACQPR